MSLERIETPVNEYGIVVPPPIQECMGEECAYRNGESECARNCHHLHSIEEKYVNAGKIAEDYRNENVLTIWMHLCRHKDHHTRHNAYVPVPRLEVMEQAIDDIRKLKTVVGNHQHRKNIDVQLARPGNSASDTSGLLRRKYNLAFELKPLMEQVRTIEVIPEELVTGALLVAAPGHARSRILTGSGYALTGTMSKDEIPQAIDAGERFTDWSERYWEEVNAQRLLEESLISQAA